MRIATLDIGTNTVLLLIVEAENGQPRVLRDDHAIARLGEGVDRTKRISDAAYRRFEAVLQYHLKQISAQHVDRIAAVGTSALRDAENRDEIIQRAKASTGIDIEIISGEEEAQWTYRGALYGMTFDHANVAVVDIGGGSTEISFGDGRNFDHGTSIDIGAVRITERCFATSPITREAAEEARLLIRNALPKDIPRTEELVAVAGTPTTLAAMHQELPMFDRAKVHNYVLSREAVGQLLDILLSTDTDTLLSHYPAVSKDRADILPAGTLILAEVMDRCGADSVRVSTQGLRYGIALREIENNTA